MPASAVHSGSRQSGRRACQGREVAAVHVTRLIGAQSSRAPLSGRNKQGSQYPNLQFMGFAAGARRPAAQRGPNSNNARLEQHGESGGPDPRDVDGRSLCSGIGWSGAGWRGGLPGPGGRRMRRWRALNARAAGAHSIRQPAMSPHGPRRTPPPARTTAPTGRARYGRIGQSRRRSCSATRHTWRRCCATHT